MPTVTTQTEYVTFDAVAALDAVPTGTPGWKGLNYTSWYRMGPRVGEDRPIPGVTGRLAVVREIDELTISQQMRFNGRKDKDGGSYSDRFAGVMTNFLYFRKHVLDYVAPRAVTFHRRNGTTAAGSVIVDDWEEVVDPESDGSEILLTMRIVVPAGVVVIP